MSLEAKAEVLIMAYRTAVIWPWLLSPTLSPFILTLFPILSVLFAFNRHTPTLGLLSCCFLCLAHFHRYSYNLLPHFCPSVLAGCPLRSEAVSDNPVHSLSSLLCFIFSHSTCYNLMLLIFSFFPMECQLHENRDGFCAVPFCILRRELTGTQ